MEELSSNLIVDPDNTEGVVQSIPSDVEAVRLMDGYSSEKLVRCAFCNQKQKHYRGFFVELSDGHMALAGNCCATKIGGKAIVNKISKKVAEKEKAANKVREKNILFDKLQLVKINLDEIWVPAEECLNESISGLYLFLGFLDYPKATNFSRARLRVTSALNKLSGEFFRHREEIFKDFSITISLCRRGPEEMEKLARDLNRSTIGALIHSCPKSQRVGPGVLMDDEIVFRETSPDRKVHRSVHSIPRIALPSANIEDLLNIVEK